jgi:ssDNA-binding Zn-finger/Zn-ribbon topoisomerase 1
VTYLNCPRCRLTVWLHADRVAPEHCPRCEARHGVKERVFLSQKPSRLLKRPLVASRGGNRPTAPA